MEESPRARRRFGPLFAAVSTLALLISSFPPPAYAAGASLFLSPSTGTFAIGTTFASHVIVKSPDQAINAVSGSLNFPADKLEVASVSKAGIISLWVAEPSFNNAAGTVNFEGIVLNPGFTGNAGTVLTVNFRAKAGGDARVTITNAAVLANDGQGTNVLAGVGAAQYTINPALPPVPGQPPVEVPPTTAGPIPLLPSVKSSTHPNPDLWYPVKDACFSWELPDPKWDVGFLIDHRPDATPPGITGRGIQTHCEKGLEDGLWYAHVRFRNGSGSGPTAHYAIRVDTTPPPPFAIFVDPDGDPPRDYRASIYTDATDPASGIERFEIEFADEETVSVKPEDMTKEHPYFLPFRSAGEYPISVKAIDRAGNATFEHAEVQEEGIHPPTITNYPSELIFGETLSISGETYPGARVEIRNHFESGREDTFVAEADGRGRFSLLVDRRLRSGRYALSARAELQGQWTDWSESVFVEVQPSLTGQITELSDALRLIILISGVLLVLLILSLVYSWYIGKKLRRAMTRQHDMLARTEFAGVTHPELVPAKRAPRKKSK